MFRKSLPIIFAIAAVAIMVAPAVNVGYATSYTAVTSSIGNQLEASYFTVGFYTEEEGNYVRVNNILLNSFEYQMATSDNVTTYSIENGTAVSLDTLYIMVEAVNMGANSYVISTECSCIFSNASEDAEAADPSIVTTITDSLGSVVSTITSGEYYGISFECQDFSVEMSSAPTTMELNLSIKAENSCMGMFLDSDDSITLTYSSSVPVVVDPTTPDYDVGEDTVTYSGVDYDAVGVSNTDNTGGGIADPDGNVNVSLNMIDNRPFCFEIHHVSGENSKLRMVVTIDGVSHTYTSNISGNVMHYIGATDKYFGIKAFLKADDWMTSTTGVVSIVITNYSGHVPDNVTFRIIFKPDS